MRTEEIRLYQMTSDDRWNQIRSDETRCDQMRLDKIRLDHIRLDQMRSDDIQWNKMTSDEIRYNICSDEIRCEIMKLNHMITPSKQQLWDMVTNFRGLLRFLHQLHLNSFGMVQPLWLPLVYRFLEIRQLHWEYIMQQQNGYITVIWPPIKK